MWKNIKDLVQKSKRNVIFNTVEYKANTEVANNFNEYFVNSIREISYKIEYVRYINQQDIINFRFKFRAICNYELRTIFKDIKKKPGHNSVNIKMILDNWNAIDDKITEN